MAVHMRLEHPETLSVSMLRRRIPKLDGYTAAVLVEITKRLLPDKLPARLRRNGGYEE